MRFTAVALMFAVLIAGCETGPGKPAGKPTTNYTGPVQLTMTAVAARGDNPDDPPPQLNAMVHLDIYLLDMPADSVSQNTEFWKRVDEEAVGTANADRLKSNGIRCGVAPRSEGLFFSQFFDREPHTARRQMVDDVHTDTIELQMEKKFEDEDLFFLNASNQIEGKSYTHGSNRLALTFGPTPRDPGAVRLTLCPEVHSEKTQLHFSPLNQEYQSPVQDIDRLYDIGLTADVPGDSFLIIAPSSDASRRTSLGGCFLINPDKTEKQEQVILIVPTFMRLDGTPMLVREPVVKMTQKENNQRNP
jgi:hypothetical protein